MAGPNFGSFEKLCSEEDGVGLHRLFRSTEAAEATAKDAKGANSDKVAREVVRAWCAGISEEGLSALCDGFRHWCDRYLESKGNARWMLTPLLWLVARPRQVAIELDRKRGGTRHREKLVEALREQFQKLQRDRDRREGALAICCELLRLYFCLGQASQCTFLLAAVSQASQKFDPSPLPKALAVTLYFLWGKHCVLDGNVTEAEQKLGWALANCPPSAAGNRRRILSYLVPCRLRLGRYPAKDVLDRNNITSLSGIAAATASGNVRRFNEELEKHEDELITLGTYLVVEKLKLLCYRNLCQHVHNISAAKIDALGKSDTRHKQDLAPYEAAFKLQDDCTPDETVCLLAHLIYIGAIRGYLSDEHKKIVYSKDIPFPPPLSWNSGK
eukprot:TRINITY_DN52445_c0_g1_i1.p1 TRINITY_DN52445_c0_g1~~TRINITY_DN52445_c0_g1_i1.p1  ORF type:complete len:386 (-),score=58.70 TRINITY_DN52445_c0_g1_i1:116-1273(-)